MKLVDILALDLKIWPEGLGDIVGQASDGTLHGENDVGPILRTDTAYTLCDDWIMDVVTRAHWQAAVDALKAEAAPAWLGVGLPPVGEVCILSGHTEHLTVTHPEWAGREVKIYAHFETDRGYELAAYVSEDHMLGGVGTAGLFIPIRTPEQVAAEERKEAISKMLRYAAITGESYRDVCGKLYDAGFRKFEIVDKDDGEAV